MDLLSLFLMVVLVSSSGALSPGPLTVATVRYSLSYGKKTGLLVSLGHTFFELPLVLAISIGIASFIDNVVVKFSIGLAGSIALIFFGLIEVYSILRLRGSSKNPIEVQESNLEGGIYSFLKRGGVVQVIFIGFIFTSLNPYFIIWWMSIGLTLIIKFLAYASLIGVLLMYIFHVWLDYAWLGFISYITHTSKKFLKNRHIELLSLMLSIVIIVLGFYLMVSTFMEFRIF
ncbi:MAG: LysE family translocator [Aigarchaeota archaeon]|nr:LysE family translocator [Aigarchaeota archaeon]